VLAELEMALVRRLNALLYRDPGRRGIVSHPPAVACIDGQLPRAAVDLAMRARAVGIVTGFPVRGAAGRWAAETDGPPGAMFLARGLMALGIAARLVTDECGKPVLEAGCDLWGIDRQTIVICPSDGDPGHAQPTADWIDTFLTSDFGRSMTHLVAVERPGPSHTLESVRRHVAVSDQQLARFEAEVPPEARDRCHNMRGEVIESGVAPTHRLFERVSEHGNVATIGLGDGGNEIGLGQLPWPVIADALPNRLGGRIACRTATRWTLLAGVSDWAAYALTLLVARLRGYGALGRDWHAQGQRELIQHLVSHGGAVDGVTRRAQATVDAIPLETYLQPLVGIREALGIE